MKKHKMHRMYPFERKQKAINIHIKRMGEDLRCFNKPLEEVAYLIKMFFTGQSYQTRALAQNDYRAD